jgi:hypothetical protein
MNGGHPKRGQADGFQINALLKVRLTSLKAFCFFFFLFLHYRNLIDLEGAGNP